MSATASSFFAPSGGRPWLSFWKWASLLLLLTLGACGSQTSNDHKLQVQVSVNDTLLALSPLSNGTATLEMNSGDRLLLEDSAGIIVTPAASDTVVVASMESNDSRWGVNLFSGSDATLLITIQSLIDPSQQATLTVHVKALPLSVNVLVNTGLVNPTPLAAGDTLLVNMRSGQTLTVNSSRATSVVVGPSSVRSSGVVSSPTQWQARLNALVASEMLITVSDAADASKTVTLRVVVAASSLSVAVRIDGVLASSGSVLAGDVFTASMRSGQVLDISGPAAFTLTETLNGASKTNYTRTSQDWNARLSSNAPTEVTLVVSDPADASSFATIKISIDPLPMEINVAVDGSTLTASPILNGETRSFSIKSGQTVSVTSTGLRINVSEALSAAIASSRTVGPLSWAATLSSAATTEVTLTVVPQGDTTRVVTVKFTVQPGPLALTVTASGKTVNSTPLLAGQTLSVALTSGDALSIDSTVAMTVGETLNTAVRTNYTQTSTRYAANFTAAAGSQVVLVIASVAEPTLAATVVVSVAPQLFTSTLGRSSNEFSSFENTFTRLEEPPLNQSTTRTVTSVAADGSYTTEIKVSGVVTYTQKEDINGNLQVFNFQTTGKSCNYTPQRRLLDFPLYVGKSTTSNWTSTCSDGISEYVSSSMQVQGIETVNIGSAAYQALRVQITLSVTGSNDPVLDGGAAGTGAYSQVWYCKWAISIQRPMFCSYTTTFIGKMPTKYLAGYSETMTQYIKP